MNIKQRIGQIYKGKAVSLKRYGFLLIVFLVFCSFFLVPCATTIAGAQSRQIVIATGSPFELGLVACLGKAFEKEHDCT